MRIGLSLLVDGSRSMDTGRPTKMRHAQRLAAMLGAVALLRWDTVQISMLADGTARATAALAAPQLLGPLVDELGGMPRGERTDLASSVRAYRRSEPGVNAAIMLTDALVEPRNAGEALRELSASAEATAIIHIVDPDDEAAPPLGPVELRDRETGDRLTVDVTESVRSRHAATFAELGRALEAAGRAHGVRYLRAPTGVDPVDLLFEAARTAEIVRT